jgi:hypothetical protein
MFCATRQPMPSLINSSGTSVRARQKSSRKTIQEQNSILRNSLEFWCNSQIIHLYFCSRRRIMVFFSKEIMAKFYKYFKLKKTHKKLLAKVIFSLNLIE